MTGTQIYDPMAGGWKDLGMLDVMQMNTRNHFLAFRKKHYRWTASQESITLMLANFWEAVLNLINIGKQLRVG
ncbi:hypothetical protein Tsubulata_019494 [Turnera subulata]|uniref:Uncharacterized protein n=1 Tax=Turnera subulata TaxID=218843 RepID=A0A9Q0F1P0_9ROSI|nr:hypothetical protein Tsubulata_019494 [Turnera subulata]